jgi:hypothetical protein
MRRRLPKYGGMKDVWGSASAFQAGSAADAGNLHDKNSVMVDFYNQQSVGNVPRASWQLPARGRFYAEASLEIEGFALVSPGGSRYVSGPRFEP